MLHAFRLAKIVRHFYQFAALWLHFDFLTTYMFPNRFTKMLISFYWFYVLSLTKNCYKFELVLDLKDCVGGESMAACISLTDSGFKPNFPRQQVKTSYSTIWAFTVHKAAFLSDAFNLQNALVIMINRFISKTNIKEHICIINLHFELEKKFF